MNALLKSFVACISSLVLDGHWICSELLSIVVCFYNKILTNADSIHMAFDDKGSQVQ